MRPFFQFLALQLCGCAFAVEIGDLTKQIGDSFGEFLKLKPANIEEAIFIIDVRSELDYLTRTNYRVGIMRGVAGHMESKHDSEVMEELAEFDISEECNACELLRTYIRSTMEDRAKLVANNDPMLTACAHVLTLFDSVKSIPVQNGDKLRTGNP